MIPLSAFAALCAGGFLVGYAAVVFWKRSVASWRTVAGHAATAKPRVRVLSGGWIRHAAGPCPIPPRTVINYADSHGFHESPRYASEVPPEWWEHKSAQFGRDVLAYRIVREAQP